MHFNPARIRRSVSFILILSFCAFAYTALSKEILPASKTQASIRSLTSQSPSPAPASPIIMIGIPDQVLSPQTKNFISQNNITGILLLSRNITSPDQLKKLTSDIHAINQNIIIGIDQEGGTISRITFPGFEQTPQKELQDESQAYIIAYKRARQLKSLGIDMNFSPVADYITNKDSFLYNRTFQKNPETIAILAGAMLRGYEDGGITPVLKHFPGHTNDSTDTHEGIATVTRSKQELALHISPFEKIISRFNPPAIMIGGSIYTAYDSLPAALSPAIIHELLQKQLGFKGMVISDDLEMQAFSQFSLAKRAKLAMEAGCNILIFSQTNYSQSDLQAALATL